MTGKKFHMIFMLQTILLHAAAATIQLLDQSATSFLTNDDDYNPLLTDLVRD